MTTLGRLSRRAGLGFGLVLLLGTNAIVLALIAANRSGEPDAVLVLSERELERPWSWRGRSGENSALALSLRWRVAPPPPRDANDRVIEDAGTAWMFGGPAGWLDPAKISELGFPPSPPGFSGRPRARQVLVVLELDGPARAAARARAEAHLAAQVALRDNNPGQKEFAERAKSAEEWRDAERHTASRLFAIDAGRDAHALRERYPDRARYAIVEGRVRPGWPNPGSKAPSYGIIEEIGAATLNVPLGLRSAVPAAALERHRPIPASGDSGFVAEVAFGQRLEPWIRALHATPPTASSPPAPPTIAQ